MGFLSSLNKKLKRELEDAKDFTTKKASGGFDIFQDIVHSDVARATGSKALAALNLSTEYGSRPLQGVFVSPFFDEERDANGNITKGNFNLRRGLSSYAKAGGKAGLASSFGLPTQIGIGMASLLKDEEKSNNPAKQYSEARRRGNAFQEDPDVPLGLKVGADIAFDPTMYIPAGTVGNVAGKTGLASTKLGKVALGGSRYLDDAGRLKTASATSRSFRVGGGVLEGAGKYTPAIAAGSGVGAEIADRTPWSGDDYIAGLAGGMVGGIAGTRALDGSLSINMIDDAEFERRVGELRKQTMSSDPEIASAAEEAIGQLNELRSRGMIQPSKKITRGAKLDELSDEEFDKAGPSSYRAIRDDFNKKSLPEAGGSANDKYWDELTRVERQASEAVSDWKKESLRRGRNIYAYDNGSEIRIYAKDPLADPDLAEQELISWIDSDHPLFNLYRHAVIDDIFEGYSRDPHRVGRELKLIGQNRTKESSGEAIARWHKKISEENPIDDVRYDGYLEYIDAVKARRESEGGIGFFGEYSSMVDDGSRRDQINTLKQGLEKNKQAIDALNKGDKETALRLFKESRELIQKGTALSGNSTTLGAIDPSQQKNTVKMYHGTSSEIRNGKLEKDAFLTPNRDDAMKLAEADARLTGGKPKVYEFDAEADAIRPSDTEGIAKARGAMQISDPDRVRLVPNEFRANVPAQKDPDSLNLPPRDPALGGDPRLAGEPNFPATRSENAGIDQAIEQGRVPTDPKIQDRAAVALERSGQLYRDPRSVPSPSPKVYEKLRERYSSTTPIEPIENIPITEMPSLRQHLNELIWGRPDESDAERAAIRLAGGEKAVGETARKKFTLNEFERPKAPPIGDYRLRAEELLKTLSDEELDAPVANLEVADLIASIVGGRDIEKILIQRAEEAAAYKSAVGDREIIPNRGIPTFDIPPKSFDEQLTPDEEVAAIGAIHDQVVGGGNNGTPPPTASGAGGAGGSSNISFVNKGEMRNRLKYLADIRPLSEEAEAVKVWTKDNPIVKALSPVMNLVNPSVLINSAVGRLITARTRQELAINEMTQTSLSAFNRFNGFGGIRNAVGKNGTVFKVDDLGIVKGIGRHWNDVFADVESFKRYLTPQQYEYAKTFNEVVDDVRLLREIHMLSNLPRDTGGKLWVPRVVKNIDNIEIINPTNHRANRYWELATDGAKNGVNYADPLETINLYLRETYSDILKQEFALEMKKITSPVESLVNPRLMKNVEIADDEFKSAKTELSFAAKQWSKDKENLELKRILDQAKAKASEKRIAQLKADFAMKEAIENLKLQETNRAYRVLEDGTKEPIATFNVARLGNRVVDRNDAELLRNYIGLSGTGLGLKELNESFVAKSFGVAGRVLRTTTSTIDVATPFIHNLPLLVVNPKAWTKAMGHNYAAIINPRVRDAYIFKNLKYINEMAAHGITVGSNEYFEALGKNGDFAKLFDKTLGKKSKARGAVRGTGRQTVGRFEAAMSTNLLVGRTELWKANREHYLKNNNLDGLSKFVRNITGALDSRSLMVSKSQRDWESFWLAFSPKLVRSTFALGAMATRIDTQEGRHAARALGVFMGTAMGTFYLSNLAYQHATGNPIDPLSEEALTPINPTAGKKFLSTETPIGYLGIGGQWRAAAQLFGNSAAALWYREPGNFLKMDQFDNPIMNWYIGRGAPGIQFGQDIIEASTGANANPYAEIGGPSDLFKAQAQNFLPFFAQNMLEAEDMKTGMLQAGIGSFGPRYSPFSEAERRDMRVQKMGFMKSDGTPAETINDLNREQKTEYYDKFPVSKITSTDNVTKMFAQIDDAEMRFNADVARMSLNVQNGRMSKAEFREWYQKRNTEKFAQIDQVKNDFSVMPADRGGFSGSVTEYISSKNTRPEDKAVDEYYAISSRVPLKDDGTIDFDGINKARAELLRDLPMNQRQYVERMTNKNSQISDNAIVQEYDIIKEVTRDYWDSDARVFEYFKQGSGFFSQFSNYEAYQEWEQKTAMEHGITPETLGGFLSKNIPDVKKFNAVKSEYKKLQRLQNPYLDRALTEWYGMEPANRYDYILSGYGSDAGAAMAPAIYNNSSLNSADRATRLALQLRENRTPRSYTDRKFYRPQRSLQ